MHREEHIRYLEEILNNIDLIPSAMMPTTFDGLVTGVLLCPEIISPVEWIPLVLGDKDDWARLDEAEAQPILDILVTHFNAVARNLLEKDVPYEVLIAKDGVGEPYWGFWVNGFLAATKLRPRTDIFYASADAKARDAFASIKLLQNITHGNSGMSDADLKVFNGNAVDLIQNMVIHMYEWLETRVVPNGPLKDIPWKNFILSQSKPLTH